MKEYLRRFDSIPDIIELDHLTVAGDVTFGRGVILKVRDFIFMKVFYSLIVKFHYYLLFQQLNRLW